MRWSRWCRGLVLAVVALAVPAPARSQETAPPIPGRVEVAPPAQAPIRMLATEGRQLGAQLRRDAPAAAVATPVPRGGVSRTIVPERTPVENSTSQFVFHDATDRTADAETKVPLSMAARRAAVEAFRQGLVRQRKGTRR